MIDDTIDDKNFEAWYERHIKLYLTGDLDDATIRKMFSEAKTIAEDAYLAGVLQAYDESR